LGAEGLAEKDGEFCRLADTPQAFAQAVLDLFVKPEEAEAMARRARREIEANWDTPVRTARLVESYRKVLQEKRGC